MVPSNLTISSEDLVQGSSLMARSTDIKPSFSRIAYQAFCHIFKFHFFLRIGVYPNSFAHAPIKWFSLTVLIDGKFSIYCPYSMDYFPSIVILDHKRWKNIP
jgi:hypothetical protein